VPDVIEVVDLTKRYGSARGVDDVSFTVAQGSIFGFLGPNGAGKSTIIRTLLDFQRPTSGRALLFGLDSRRDSVAIRRRLGYLPGDLVLFEQLSGQAHLDHFGKARGGLDRAVVDDLVERFGVELHRPVKELSKGNKQKVGLLLAFAHRPELVVLDEPTSGLDPLVQDQFHQLLRETAADGRTVVLSSHSLDEVQRVADRVTVIRQGQVVVTDTIASLQAQVPRRVTFHFEGPFAVEAFSAIPDTTVLHADARSVTVTVKGGMDAVVKAASGFTVGDVVAAPADLEELFLGFYQGDDARPTEEERGGDGGGAR
jgi:ABC-2 type transport system ATP-binding protein